MATVNCRYCKKQFDREKVAFVQIPCGKVFRYGHAECYTKAVNEGKEKQIYKIWDPAKASTCFWCHKAIEIDSKDVIPMPELPNRYVHKNCAVKHPENDLEKLMIYIIQLYKLKDNYIPPAYMKQVTQYEKDYEFTYSGMLKALKYWYEVKKNPLDTNRGIGIIPYIYNQAKEYYYALYLANLQNEQIQDYKEYIPKDIEIKIKSPEKKVTKRRLFTFLEEDNIDGK